MAMVGQLQEMGFPADDSQQAVLACGARSIEACIERVMNPDVQTAPPVFAPPVGGGTPPSSCYSDPGTAVQLQFAPKRALPLHTRWLSRLLLIFAASLVLSCLAYRHRPAVRFCPVARLFRSFLRRSYYGPAVSPFPREAAVGRLVFQQRR